MLGSPGHSVLPAIFAFVKMLPSFFKNFIAFAIWLPERCSWIFMKSSLNSLDIILYFLLRTSSWTIAIVITGHLISIDCHVNRNLLKPANSNNFRCATGFTIWRNSSITWHYEFHFVLFLDKQRWGNLFITNRQYFIMDIHNEFKCCENVQSHSKFIENISNQHSGLIFQY